MRAWPLIALLLLALLPLAAQDVQVLTATFTKNFERADDLDTRAAVVRDAVASKVPGMGAFYHKVLEFALQSAADIPADGRLREMVVLASATLAGGVSCLSPKMLYT